MNKIFLSIAVFSLLFSSCQVYQDLEVKEVRDIRIVEVTSEGLVAEVDLKIYNPNGYKLTLVNVDADLYLNDNDIGDAEINERVTIEKKSNLVYTIRLEGDFAEMGGNLLQSFLGSVFNQALNLKIDGTIKGRALLIGKSIYFEVEQDVKLEN